MPPNHGDTANGIASTSKEQIVETTCPGTTPATPNLMLLRDTTSWLGQLARSVRHHLNTISGGGDRTRTDDPLLAKQVLSQLSYTPSVVGDQ